jgi:membrane associated rhomboid family serine protease
MSVRKVRDAFVLVGGFVVLIWVLQVFNWADGYRLDSDFAIYPHNVGRLVDIFTAPFLHVSWQHIEGNTLPLFVLGVLAAYRGIGKFLLVTLIVAVTSGLAVWLFQSSNTVTVGASGIIFGYFGYVLIRGFFDRNLLDIGLGVVAGLLYWTILQVAIPGTPGVSWIDHLGGLIGGVVAAWVLRTHAPAGAASSGGWKTSWRTGWTTGLGPDSSGSSGGRSTGGGGAGTRSSAGTGGSGTVVRRGAETRGTETRGSGNGASGSQTGHPGSRAAADLLRELDDMGL